jgi:hypothetical protein
MERISVFICNIKISSCNIKTWQLIALYTSAFTQIKHSVRCDKKNWTAWVRLACELVLKELQIIDCLKKKFGHFFKLESQSWPQSKKKGLLILDRGLLYWPLKNNLFDKTKKISWTETYLTLSPQI